ncbi:TBC1 domain family member 13 [Planococcus citri]|uniref:TBC1 domain family member 13 n=1 Tax=Planococcus citri TaxID=170843 RepID=UPI0031F7DBF4
MAGYKIRLKAFEEALSQDEINMNTLRSLCFNGIPEEKGLRPLCWKLLMNYLPPERNSWSKTLTMQRNLYNQFIDEMIVTPGSDTNEDTSCDHPLSNNPSSKWNTYFKDNEVLLQIDKDVRRLNPEISFFQQATDYPCDTVVNSGGRKRLHRRVQSSVLNSANVERKGLGLTKIALSKRKSIDDYSPLEEGSEAHWEVVERILFLYAKLNPGQGYVQGMNEIIGPIYYCFASDTSSEWQKHAEADCFFTFTNLMSEIRDFFIKSLDEAECGIGMLMTKLTDKVRSIDYSIHMHLTKLQLYPQYYSFRWLTLLLSQEFPLPDVLRIWDSLFADQDRFSFLIYICSAMIVLIKNQLLDGDFSSNVKLLQNYPSTDIQIVLSKAVELSQNS